jgi:hypothetical protein
MGDLLKGWREKVPCAGGWDRQPCRLKDKADFYVRMLSKSRLFHYFFEKVFAGTTMAEGLANQWFCPCCKWADTRLISP